MLKHLAHSITLALIAISLSGCMFSDQDASAFQEMMSIWDTPQTSDKDTCTPTSSNQCPSGTDDNTGNNHNDEPQEPPQPSVELNKSVYKDMCNRIIKCKATYKTENTCIGRYQEYVQTIPECVEAAEDYYLCISQYSCKATASCMDYVYIYDNQLQSQCEENQYYQESSYYDCLHYLCDQSQETFDCDDSLIIYEDCVRANYGLDKREEHSQIVESIIEEYYIAHNCGCYNYHNDCAQTFFDRDKARSCFKTIKDQSKQYPACIPYQEAYYYCTTNGSGSSSIYTSSRNQYAIDAYTTFCKTIILDEFEYETVNECVTKELQASRESKKNSERFQCEAQQDAYDDCMMRNYGVLPVLVSVRK